MMDGWRTVIFGLAIVAAGAMGVAALLGGC